MGEEGKGRRGGNEEGVFASVERVKQCLFDPARSTVSQGPR